MAPFADSKYTLFKYIYSKLLKKVLQHRVVYTTHILRPLLLLVGVDHFSPKLFGGSIRRAAQSACWLNPNTLSLNLPKNSIIPSTGGNRADKCLMEYTIGWQCVNEPATLSTDAKLDRLTWRADEIENFAGNCRPQPIPAVHPTSEWR